MAQEPPPVVNALLLIHAASTLAMTGLIWFVQIVHYPAYRCVPQSTFRAYQDQHTQRTRWVVMPLMLTELGSSLCVAWIALPFSGIGLTLLVTLWASTFFIQVPLHTQLTLARSDVAIEKLIRTNWIRSILWTSRSAIALHWLAPP